METTLAVDKAKLGQAAFTAFVGARQEREPQHVILSSRVESQLGRQNLLRPIRNHPFAFSIG
jgi:hypothetical protein